MSQAYNVMMDSYLKRLKRPEFADFNPDQSFGANMVHGSEEQNPWANRNQDNAKYGSLGGTNNKVVQGPQAISGGDLDPSLIGKSFTMPPSGMAGNQSQNALDSLIGVITRPVTDYLGKSAGNAISNWMKPADKLGDTGWYKYMNESMELPQDWGNITAGLEQQMGQGSTDLMKGFIENGSSAPAFSIDPVSMGLAAVPALGQLAGLKGSAADGLGAASSVGAAALQGGLNPIADVSAIMSLVKLFGGLF